MLFSLHELRAQANWHARRATLGVVGGLLLLVGIGFVVAAIWMLVATAFSPLAATLACAALFLGAGMIVLLVRSVIQKPVTPQHDARMHASATRKEHPELAREFPALMEAFLFGLSTYLRVRNERK